MTYVHKKSSIHDKRNLNFDAKIKYDDLLNRKPNFMHKIWNHTSIEKSL